MKSTTNGAKAQTKTTKKTKSTKRAAAGATEQRAPVNYDPDRISEYVMRARDAVDRMTASVARSGPDGADSARFVSASQAATGVLDEIRDAMKSARAKRRVEAPDAGLALEIIANIEDQLGVMMKELVHLTSVDRENYEARPSLITLIATARDLEVDVEDLKGRFDVHESEESTDAATGAAS